MNAVWYRARAELREHGRQLVALALLIGVAGGIVLASVAGARRTSTAFRRERLAARAHDVTLSSGAPVISMARQIARLPQVESFGTVAGLGLTISDPKPPADVPFNALPPPYGIVEPSFGHAIDRPKITSGRMPDYTHPDEALVNVAFARENKIRPGQTVTVERFSDPAAPKASAVRATLRVVGVAVFPTEIVPIARFDDVGFLYVTPAFFEKYGGADQALFVIAHFRLHPGASIDAFHIGADRILRAHRYPVESVIFSTEQDRLQRVNHAISPLALAFVIFAFVAGAVALLLIGQALARHIFVASADYETLRAVGLSPRALLLVVMIRVGVAIIAGAALAVGFAIAASPLSPIGAARLAEPSPGLAVNVAVLAIGGAAIVLALFAVVMIPAVRAARARRSTEGAARPSRVARALVAMPVTVSTGVRLALEPGSGRRAVPVRSTMVGTIAALVAVVATLTFGTSLTHLIDTPTSYGQTWDVAIDSEFFSIPRARQQELASDRDIDGLTGGRYGALFVGDHTIPAVGLDPLKGDLYPRILAGRPARTADEVVLGTTTLESLHKKIGDTVAARFLGPLTLRIVGRAVFPRLGPGIFTPTGLGEGAILVGDPLKDPEAPDYTFLLAHVRPGGNRTAVIARMRGVCASNGGICATELLQRPADIGTFAGVTKIPFVLASLLALIGAAVLGNALVTSVRRRRGQLAILKTLGFVRAQVVGAVAWQATTFVVVASLFGVPLGIALARWGWARFVSSIGVPFEPRASVLALVVLVPAAAVIANLIAVFPARAAAHTQPASVLRTE
ncbi:MAG: FtsX-like permease family protein [Actinomycetota bacterium]